MPAIPSAKRTKTKWIGYRGTLPEHTAIKTAAAKLGITVGVYLAQAIQHFRKTGKFPA